MTHLALVLSLSIAFAPTASATPLLAYTPNALNQYTAVGGTTQTYDANGNLTADGSATYTFDAENRLTQVLKSGVTTSFTYDALGRRATKTVGGVATKCLYDGADFSGKPPRAVILT